MIIIFCEQLASTYSSIPDSWSDGVKRPDLDSSVTSKEHLCNFLIM